MQFGPKQLNNNDNVYVVIETCQFSGQFRVIGVTYSLIVAQTYLKSNVTIQGPIKILDTTAKHSVFDNPKFFDFTPKPLMFDTDELPKPNFITPNPFNNDIPRFDSNPFNNNTNINTNNFGSNPFNNIQQLEQQHTFNFNIPPTQQFNGFNPQQIPKPRRRINYNSNNVFNSDNMDIC